MRVTLLLFLVMVASEAFAAPIRWHLRDVAFGSPPSISNPSITGFFDYDPDTGDVTNVNIMGQGRSFTLNQNIMSMDSDTGQIWVQSQLVLVLSIDDPIDGSSSTAGLSGYLVADDAIFYDEDLDGRSVDLADGGFLSTSPAPIPLPGAAPLLASAFLGACGLARRRSRRGGSAAASV